MRIFTGFEINQQLIHKILSFKKQNKLPGLRFIKCENLHITSFFIGEINPHDISLYVTKLEGLTNTIKPFSLVSSKIDFSQGKSPYMIWQYFEHSNEFNQCCKQIGRAHV